jgi:hypothetical protein
MVRLRKPPCVESGSASRRAYVDARAAKLGRLDLDLFHLFARAIEDVAIEHDEVGELARLERSLPRLVEREERVVDRVEANRLLAREVLLGDGERFLVNTFVEKPTAPISRHPRSKGPPAVSGAACGPRGHEMPLPHRAFRQQPALSIVYK